jgi:DNA invertase Pin-like site-specific DNA recombinase
VIAAVNADLVRRSLQHLVGCLGDIHPLGVNRYRHQQGLDTSKPSGRALFGMLGVFANFERALNLERVRCGMARAKAEGVRPGRPHVAKDQPELLRSCQLGADCTAIRVRDASRGSPTRLRLQPP